ncbi:recombinase family protein [Paenibacillus aceti]|uniref:Serine recombinase n=1 Tax=Paenibacillus aceti TaxID=1820010 RepID=A0ABQ1W8F2_9BACL|nr:recombinase family protein [Paenibacillus aceti]GGG19752.1 serine recombinase [Paenibacillus aceti]
MKVTFYARVSSDSEEQKKSIQSQISYFNDYIERNGYERVEEGIFYRKDGTCELTEGYYVDEGYSGAKSYRHRKAFQEMMKDAKQRKFEMLFVKDIKRFGRNVRETLECIAELKKNNIGVYFDDIQANTLKKDDEFKINMFAALAEQESTSKSSSVHFGKMQGFKKGKWGGKKPYGYNIKEGKLVIKDEEAKIVKIIFDLYINQGMGLRSIAMKLNEQGIPTQSGKNVWDQSLISKLLSNKVYTGEIRNHRTRKTDINLNIIEKVPPEKQIIVQDESIRIIDDELFNRVQIEKDKRLKMHGNFNLKKTLVIHEDGSEEFVSKNTLKRSDTRYSNKHIFSNLLKCGNCGGSLRRKVQNNPTKTYILWFCRNNDQFGKYKCSERNLQHEQELLENIQEEIRAYKDLNIIWERYFSYYLYLKYETTESDESISELNEGLKKLENRRQQILDLYLEGKIEKEHYEVVYEQVNNDISDIKEKINRQVYKEKMISEDVLRFKHFIEKINSVDVDNLSNTTLREIFECIVINTKDGFRDYSLKWKFMGTSFDELDLALKENIRFRKKRIGIQNNGTVEEELSEEEVEAMMSEIELYAEPYLI